MFFKSQLLDMTAYCSYELPAGEVAFTSLTQDQVSEHSSMKGFMGTMAS